MYVYLTGQRVIKTGNACTKTVINILKETGLQMKMNTMPYSDKEAFDILAKLTSSESNSLTAKQNYAIRIAMYAMEDLKESRKLLRIAATHIDLVANGIVCDVCKHYNKAENKCNVGKGFQKDSCFEWEFKSKVQKLI